VWTQEGGDDNQPSTVITNPPFEKKNSPFITNEAKKNFAAKKAEEAEEEESKKGTEGPSKPPRKPFSPPGSGYGPKPTGNSVEVTDGMIEVRNPTHSQEIKRPSIRIETWDGPTQKPDPKDVKFPYDLWKPIPGYPHMHHMFAPTAAYSVGPRTDFPVQNVYNITMPSPAGDGHVKMDQIYEIALPNKNKKFSFVTIGERIQMNDYIRQILVTHGDGEDIGLEACKGQKNILSYLKVMEIGSNRYNLLNDNPYRSLPHGMILYKTCFPITLEMRSKKTMCAKNSIGLNLRLYSLSVSEFCSHYTRNPLVKKYDVWREIIAYEYIREQIIKKKQSPNFTTLHSFFLSDNANIDFFCLKKNTLTQKDMLTAEFKRFKRLHDQAMPSSKILSLFSTPTTIAEHDRLRDDVLPDEVDPSLQRYSGKVLVAVTEASNHNMYKWASSSFESDGMVYRMTSTGVHPDSIWFNVLFQITAAWYTMYCHCIYYRDMQIGDNIYIKDLMTGGSDMGFWKWTIDGIPYYVPNQGYLVVIDSNFKDIAASTTGAGTSVVFSGAKREHKVYSHNLFGEVIQKSDIRDKIKANFIEVMSTNAFTKEYTQNNLKRPSGEVMNFIDRLNQAARTGGIEAALRQFTMFMNNRIGTYLKKDSEIPNLRATLNPKKGDMVARIVDADTYVWGMYMDNGSVIDTMSILTKDDPNVATPPEIQAVHAGQLRSFSPSEKIEQNYAGIKLGDEEMLESYVLNFADLA